MTNEKKPPQAVAERQQAGAQIVLNIEPSGAVRMAASCWGTTDSTYTLMSDERLLRWVLPVVLAELRDQIKLGRRLTVAESATIAANARQSEAGSVVTV